MPKHLFALTAAVAFVLISCSAPPSLPRPAGYLRIDLPEHSYQVFDSAFPYHFEYSTSAEIEFDDYTKSGLYWLNITYPEFKGKIHVSYKSLLENDLYNLSEDARNFVYRHADKAQGIRELIVENPENRVFGMAWRIEGKEAASPFQFWVTDSTEHYLRGALYFSVRPNNDSLKPVIDFIVSDIDHLLATIEWK